MGNPSDYMYTQNEYGHKYVPAQYNIDSSGNVTGLVGTDGGPIGLYSQNIYGYKPENYRKSRAAFNKVRAGTANAKVLRIGDSTEAGKGALVAGSNTNCYAQSPTARFATLMNSTPMPVKHNTFLSDHNLGDIASLKAYDTRITTTGATNVWNGVNLSACSAPIRFPGASSSVTYTADVACDTWEITYLDNSAAQFTWQIGAGASTQVNQANSAALVRITVTGTAATTLTLAWVSGTVGIWDVRGYNAATKEVSVFNAGVLSWASGDFISVSNYYTSLNHIKKIAPDLTIIRLGINDWNQATPIPVTTYSANMQTIITAAQISGDVILTTPVPSQVTATMTAAGQKEYIDAIYALAATNGLAVVDIWRRLGSYAESSALYYSDASHQNAAGYYDIAKAEAELIGTL